MNQKLKSTLYYMPRLILLAFTLFWLIFALLSGAAELGGGIKGIILNSPNAIPWALLLILNWVSFKWPLAGGTIVALMGALSFFAFDGFENPFVVGLLVLPLIIVGIWIGVTSNPHKEEPSPAR
jgi:uncharacterized membrane protein